MTDAVARPERLQLAPGLEISRVVTGLWQVADMERDGNTLDRATAAAALAAYAEAGYDTFDMADHYGSAELIVGRLLADARTNTPAAAPALPPGRRPVAFTKWCPPPGPMTADVVRAGVERARSRLGVDVIDLLQLHWWMYEHPAYLDAMAELAALRRAGLIAHLGLTNFNTDHLRVLVGEGCVILTNQVCFSLLDRRAAGAMTEFCRAHGIRLLAYGTLGGGFLSERWLGQAAPTDLADWSKMKYRRFIDAIGGWDVLQTLLAALARVAAKHGVSIANVATRWVLEQPAVAAVIVGVRPGEQEHRSDNLRLFGFALDVADHALIEAALTDARDLPGDCGDEYRRPPFLTASGDLSHHLDSLPKAYPTVAANGRLRVDTGSVWEASCGFSRAVRVGDRILVSGTTATHGAGAAVCKADLQGQTVYILDKIGASVAALGGSLADIVLTRVYLRDAAQWEAVAAVHGRYFADVRPVNTLVEVSRLVGDYAVEIEAEAIVRPASCGITSGGSGA